MDVKPISIKKHEMEIWEHVQNMFERINMFEAKEPGTRNQQPKTLNLFYFQVRESPAPRNIPTPTLAPDRGGPVWNSELLDYIETITLRCDPTTWSMVKFMLVEPWLTWELKPTPERKAC